MMELVLASLFFPFSHFLISRTRLRAMAVSRLGEKGYTLGYSLLAVAVLVWLFVAYRNAPAHPLWDAPRWLDLALVPVIVVSTVLAVAGVTTPNPVITGFGALFQNPDIVRGVLRVSRNPFFWGVALFSTAQIIMLGDVATLVTFGSLGALGIAGTFILDAKKARELGKAWDGFAAVTSSMPFLAIIEGRQRLDWREIGWWRISLGISLGIGTAVAALAWRGL